MSALTLWIVLTVCTSLSGSKHTEYKVFVEQESAVSYAAPDPEAISVNCEATVYESHLEALAAVEPEPAPELVEQTKAPEETPNE